MTFHRYAVRFRRPDSSELHDLSRQDKYQRLRGYSRDARVRLERWLTAQHLDKQVTDIGAETAFDTIFLAATDEAAKALKKNPDILAVTQADKLRVDLSQ